MTAKIYKGQSSVELRVTTGLDFATTASAYSIEYISPTGSSGSWAAQIYTPESSSGVIYVDFTSGSWDDGAINFNHEGTWTLFSNVTFADGRQAPGETYKYYVREEGTL